MAYERIFGDITTVKCDAVVTPASRYPRVGKGLDKIIHDNAGDELLEARMRFGNMQPGDVNHSPAFGLSKKTKAKFVIHAVGPIWTGKDEAGARKVLECTYLRILLRAKELGCKTLAMPVLSSGRFGMPLEDAVAVAENSIAAFLAAFPEMTVKLVRPEDPKDRGRSVLTFDEEEGIFQDALFHEVMDDTTFKEAFRRIWDRIRDLPEGQYGEGIVNRAQKRLRSATDLAKASGINWKTIVNYSTPSSGSETTSKDKIFALSVALRLPVKFAEGLLSKCRHRFVPGDKRDMLIKKYIAGRGGSVYDLDVRLHEAGFPVLSVTRSVKNRRG